MLHGRSPAGDRPFFFARISNRLWCNQTCNSDLTGKIMQVVVPCA
jgi:hypothetical protein